MTNGFIVGLAGFAGAGKSSVAQILEDEYGFVTASLAAPVKALAEQFAPRELKERVRLNGWDVVKRTREGREILQNVGEGCRNLFGDDVWIKRLEARLRHPAYSFRNIVISDVRYPNEADWVRENGGVVVWVDRPDVEPYNAHPSEAADFLCDHVILNYGDFDDLREEVGALWGLMS